MQRQRLLRLTCLLLALSGCGSGELVLVVLLQAKPKERTSLYEQAFLPAVDALKPAE